jgi:hypothetical protein
VCVCCECVYSLCLDAYRLSAGESQRLGLLLPFGNWAARDCNTAI